MKLKISELEINFSDPFKNDALERKESAEILTNILHTINEPFVIALDSPWGTGKSTFIKMWRQELENKGFPSIYYNAWENDFSDDALLSLMAEIGQGIDELKVRFEISGETIRKLDQVKKVSAKLLKSALPTLLKMATYGFFDIKNLSSESVADFVDEFAKEKIKEYDESKKTLAEFKKQLKEFVSELMATERCEKKPLIIFIDELDRCRPIFAIEVLEKVKHFFNISGIVFILSIDKEQLGNSIGSVYGLNVKRNGYLKRFIDLEYNLPEPPKGLFVKFLLRSFDFDSYFDSRSQSRFKEEREEISFIFEELSLIFNLSLREQLQLCTNLSLAIRMTSLMHPIFALPLSFLIVLKHVKRDLYYSYIEGNENWTVIEDFVVNQKRNQLLFKNIYGFHLIAFFKWFESKDYYTSINWKEFDKVLEDPNSLQEEKDRARTMVSKLSQLNNTYGLYGNGVLKSIIKKIELLDNFKSDVN